MEQVAESIGASLEAIYYAFGDDDVFLIVDAPDNVSAAAISLLVNASGVVKVKTTMLMIAEEVDEATKKTVEYRPPGQ